MFHVKMTSKTCKTVMVIFLVSGTSLGFAAGSAQALHNEDEAPAQSYYVGGFATHGAGVFPNLQEGVGVCQGQTWENLHTPLGVGGACRLRLDAGPNVVWVHDEYTFLWTGHVHHQEGFWYACYHWGEDGEIVVGSQWIYANAMVRSEGVYFYYAEIEGGDDCLMVDVALPVMATYGQIQVTRPCEEFVEWQDPCVGQPEYEDELEQWLGPVRAIYNKAWDIWREVWDELQRFGLFPVGGEYLATHPDDVYKMIPDPGLPDPSHDESHRAVPIDP